MFSEENSAAPQAVEDKGVAPVAPLENKATKMPNVESVKGSSVGSLGVLVLIATIIAIVGTGVLYLYKTARVSRLGEEKNRYIGLQSQLNAPEMAKFANDLQEVNDGQSSLSDVLNSKIYWSGFWSKLGEVTPTTIHYSSMSVDSAGTVSLAGDGKDLTSVAKLMVSLQSSPLFSNIALGNTSAKDKGDGTFNTAFSVTLKVNSNKLLVVN